jgi:hypothetical protein
MLCKLADFLLDTASVAIQGCIIRHCTMFLGGAGGGGWLEEGGGIIRNVVSQYAAPVFR